MASLRDLLTQNPDNVLTFLTELHLEAYYDKFIEEGYDDFEFFVDLKIQDLLEMGMKKGHAKRVIGKINRVSNNNIEGNDPMRQVPSIRVSNNNTESNDPMRQVPSVDPSDADFSMLAASASVPIAHAVVAVGTFDTSNRSRSSSSDSLSGDMIALRVETASNKLMKRFDSGDVWNGQMKGNKRHGYGTYTFSTGSKYVGQWKNDKKDGLGLFTLSNGGIYVGQFKKDRQCGNGSYTNATSGNTYIGQWKNGKPHGQGTCTEADGITIYHSGQWKNGKPITLDMTGYRTSNNQSCTLM